MSDLNVDWWARDISWNCLTAVIEGRAWLKLLNLKSVLLAAVDLLYCSTAQTSSSDELSILLRVGAVCEAGVDTL